MNETFNEYLKAIVDSAKSIPTIFYPDLNYFTFGAIIAVLCYVVFPKLLKHRRNYKPRPFGTYTKQLSRELLWSIISQITFIFTGVTLYFLFKDIGFYSGPRDVLDNYNPILVAIVTFIIYIISHDTWFYWTHKLMHHPKTFRHAHKIHHLSKEINPLSSVAFHPIEAIINGSYAIIPAILFPLSPIGGLIFGIFELAHTVYAHSGYELFPSGFTKHWLTKHIITSTHHNMHHERVGGHYGLYFMWWDCIMKTEFEDYHTRFESLANSKLEPIQVELKQFKY